MPDGDDGGGRLGQSGRTQDTQNMTESNNSPDDSEQLIDLERRRVLQSAAALAGVGAAGLYVGSAAAQVGSPSGEVGSLDDPYLHAWSERIVFVARTSAVSSISSSDYAALYVREDL